MLIGCPDNAGQSYRGARPELLARAGLEPPEGFSAQSYSLNICWNSCPAIREAVENVSSHIRLSGMSDAFRKTAVAKAEGATGSVRIAELGSLAQEAAHIAYELRWAHFMDAIPWDEMAVLTRSNNQISLMESALKHAGVPIALPGVELAVREEAAVRPFLIALHCSCAPEGLNADVAAQLLSSPIGGLDAAGLRRLRRTLRTMDKVRGGRLSSDALLVEALQNPGLLDANARGAEAEAARRCARVLAAGNKAAAQRDADAGTVLWKLWDSSGLAEKWQVEALSAGPDASRADKALDAMTALFAAAERYVDRVPGASPAMFEEYLLGQDLPGDMITRSAPAHNSVTLCTAASALGRHWEYVVVAGVQEGQWPNLKLRDTTLNAGELVDLLESRDVDSPYSEKRRAILDDELRSFVLALSRARSQLLLTAINKGDDRPSPFLDIIDPPNAWPRDPEHEETTLNPRTMVA
ncbi:MAG: ATP-dependent helicase, partial [bacterium]|nr:ATP-dependent helicase [bacterium]